MVAVSSTMTIQDPSQLDLFVEQAEYLEDNNFEEWTVSHPDEQLIIKKLSQSGAKLIAGPRGCGKTTLLLKVHRDLCAKPAARTLSIYVNFKTSLRLEPYYKSSANASHLFHQWLLHKVYAGLFETLQVLKAKPVLTLRLSKEATQRNIEALERGDGLQDDRLTPAGLEQDIQSALDALKYRRCVLLLDDAAHAFSVEQQRDFFDFFRMIKGKTIAPKAAIYPGVMNFPSTFHVGHDAEEIDVWLRPDSPKYLPFMKLLVRQRVSDDVWIALTRNEGLLDFLAYAAFGVPRTLLNMLRTLHSGDGGGEATLGYTRIGVLRAIRASNEATMAIFNSLAKKLPMYEKFILAGDRSWTDVSSLRRRTTKARGLPRRL